MTTWNLTAAPRPWASAPSIYERVIGDLLDPPRSGLRWAAGARAGVAQHHGYDAPEECLAEADAVVHAVAYVLDDASEANLRALYDLLVGTDAFAIVDVLAPRLDGLDVERLEALAVWLAREAPDWEPVKIALTILAATPAAEHRALYLALGAHDELTRFAIDPLRRIDGDAGLFALAQSVRGWGRIQVVEHLAGTRDPAVQAWMLREGYKNAIEYEYLAYRCAMTGGLRLALEADQVDEALMAGAGDLIAALVRGGPAENIDEYDDGAVVVERYLHHVAAAPDAPGQRAAIHWISRFLADPYHLEARAARGWTAAHRARLQAVIAQIGTSRSGM